MAAPDRIRFSEYHRITVLKALKLYVEKLVTDTTRDKSLNWAAAMEAYKLARSLALREKGRRIRWSMDWYFDFDSGRPLKEMDQWITTLEAKYSLRPLNLKPVSDISAKSSSEKIPSVADSTNNI